MVYLKNVNHCVRFVFLIAVRTLEPAFVQLRSRIYLLCCCLEALAWLLVRFQGEARRALFCPLWRAHSTQESLVVKQKSEEKLLL